MVQWRVPLFSTQFDEAEEQAILRPLRAAWLTMGAEVQQLEAQMCEMSGARHAIAVTNCTAALQLACAAVGVGQGDEVICPALTFVATANAPRSLGAEIRFCESVGPDDLTLDPKSVEAQITERTKAIMAVHFAGFPCQMEALTQLAEKHDLAIIEDCAHALFTFHEGKALGRLGSAGCFSFFSNKNATCGEGGAVLTDDDDLADKLRLMRSHGMTTLTLDRHEGRAFSYDVVYAGYNFRMDEIRAALMGEQLKKLPDFLDARRRLFRHYAARLDQTPITLPFATGRFEPELDQIAVHVLPVILPEDADRHQVMQRMKDAGIQTSIHYPPVHHFQAYRDSGQSLPLIESLCARELTLPLYPTMGHEKVDLVVDELLKAIG